jgi:hypothetical protein
VPECIKEWAELERSSEDFQEAKERLPVLMIFRPAVAKSLTNSFILICRSRNINRRHSQRAI